MRQHVGIENLNPSALPADRNLFTASFAIAQVAAGLQPSFKKNLEQQVLVLQLTAFSPGAHCLGLTIQDPTDEIDSLAPEVVEDSSLLRLQPMARH
jgi:hypothetical protein